LLITPYTSTKPSTPLSWSPSWYGLSSFLFHLFSPFLPFSLLPFISDPIQLHLLILCLPLCQLQGIFTQPCYIHYQTSLGLVLDLLRPGSHAKGYHLYTIHTFV